MWEAIPGSVALGLRGSGGHARQLKEGVIEQITTGASGMPSPRERWESERNVHLRVSPHPRCEGEPYIVLIKKCI